MSANLYKLPYTKTIANMIFEAKYNELLRLADKYNIDVDSLKIILFRKLSESKMKVGTCITTIDFLIIETLDKNKLYKSVEDAIAENILASAIYYANIANKPEYV